MKHRYVSYRFLIGIIGACLFVFAIPIVTAGRNQPAPDALGAVAINQQPGVQVPLDAEFTDSNGQQVRFGDYTGKNPILLIPGYFHCTNLCDTIRQGVLTSLQSLSLDAGKDFDVVAVSIDPAETPTDAAAERTEFVRSYQRTESGIHFLTGEQPSIARLMQSIGYQYVYDPATQQFAHPAGIVLLTPQGQVSRYFYGVEFPPEQLRLGLVEASGNHIGSLVDQVLLRCFHYDPVTGKYSLLILNVLAIAGAGTVLVLGAAVFVMLRWKPGGKT